MNKTKEQDSVQRIIEMLQASKNKNAPVVVRIRASDKEYEIYAVSDYEDAFSLYIAEKKENQ